MPGKKKSKKKVKKNTSSEGSKMRVTPTFRTNIEKAKKYAKHHGIPTYTCKDKEGKQVFYFLKDSKGYFKKGTLSDEAIGLLDSINGFSIRSGGFLRESNRAQNIAQFGTADSNQIRNINKKHKMKAARKAQAKASAELTAQQSSSAKTSVEKFLVHGIDFAKDYTNFDVIKESRRPYAHLGHSSLVLTNEFETCPDDDSKKKLDVKKLKPYYSLSEKSKARVNHNHTQPPQHVYAHAGGIGATFFAAKHWADAHMKHIQQHGEIVILDDGKRVCQIRTQLHFFFPWQRDFHMFNQIRGHNNGGINQGSRLLARCKHPVSPGATLELTFHVPVELMYKDAFGRNDWKMWSPALFHFHKAVEKTWVHLDGNLEAVLNWDFNDRRVVATDIGIMSKDLYQQRFAASASPLTGMVRSTGNDSDEDSVTIIDVEEQDDSLQLAIHKSLLEDDDVTETSIAGIENKLNTCYINSVLQAIYSIPQFLLKLGRFYNESTQKSKLQLTKAILEIAVTTGSLKADLVPSISTDNARSKDHGSIAADASGLKTVIDSLTDRFPCNTHEDSHELLVFLLDNLREEGKAALKAASEVICLETDVICLETDDNDEASNDGAPIDVYASDSSTVGTTALPVDEFFGLIIRQSLTCLVCQQSRSKEEPYDMLSIQMEENNE
eukprot:scaffold19142_cov95-Skeletonema_marinoi.AAC.2